jgi:hypothetical protein
MGITEDRHTIGITGIECITVTTVIIITIAIGATRGTRTNNKTGRRRRGQSSLLTQVAALGYKFAMPRQLRIQHEGAIYHLMILRGCAGLEKRVQRQDNGRRPNHCPERFTGPRQNRF